MSDKPTAPAAPPERPRCDAVCEARGGMPCELDAGHRGLHATGARAEDGPRFWSGPWDLCDRAALIAEADLLRRWLDRLRGQGPDGAPVVARMRARLNAICETLYGFTWGE